MFYLGADRRMMAVDVRAAGPNLEAGLPRPLFPLPGASFDYTVTADGQRFLFNAPLEESASEPATVVLNWTAR